MKLFLEPIVLTMMALAAGHASAQTDPVPDTAVTAKTPEVVARINQFTDPLARAGHLSGVLVVARGDTVIYERAWGMADYELRSANHADTLFNIASVTKPLTQIIAVSMIEDGAMSADDAISKWLRDFPRGDTITVGMLLNHRSGIPHRVTSRAEETVPRTAEDMVALAQKSELLFEPGTSRTYSSAGYSVLARILELISGKTYATLLDEYVFEPSGAVHSAHPTQRGLIEGRAESYFHDGFGPIRGPLADLSFLVGAGSVYSTPRDLLQIQRSLIAGDFGKTVREQLVSENGIRWNGYTNGYRAFADFHQQDDLTVIFTGNMFTGAADLLRASIPLIARGEVVEQPVVPQVEPFPMSEADQGRIRGSYRLGSDNQLLAFDSPVFATLGDWILIPVSRNSFFSPQDYAHVTVVSGESGGEALQWGQGPRFSRVD